jgi:tetratricopeptide (TPR) repeat protein
MTEPSGSDAGRFAMTINRAIDMGEAGDIAQAVQLLSSLVEEFTEAASARGYLGWFLSQLGRHEEAIEQSRHAIRIAPGSEKASLIHFQVLWKSGKHIEALDEMKRFLTIRPSQIYTEIIKEWKPDLERDK